MLAFNNALSLVTINYQFMVIKTAWSYKQLTTGPIFLPLVSVIIHKLYPFMYNSYKEQMVTNQSPLLNTHIRVFQTKVCFKTNRTN